MKHIDTEFDYKKPISINFDIRNQVDSVICQTKNQLNYFLEDSATAFENIRSHIYKLDKAEKEIELIDSILYIFLDLKEYPEKLSKTNKFLFPIKFEIVNLLRNKTQFLLFLLQNVSHLLKGNEEVDLLLKKTEELLASTEFTRIYLIEAISEYNSNIIQKRTMSFFRNIIGSINTVGIGLVIFLLIKLFY